MSRRAYTLVELLVAMALGLIILGIGIGVFVNQMMSYQALDLARTAQDASRDALLFMEPALRRAGFGIDPRYALDFSNYACACTTAPCDCRDHIDAPDEIVFVARNPLYYWVDDGVSGCSTVGGCFSGHAWSVSATSTTSVTVSADVGDQFLKGRVVQVVCSQGSASTMATIATTTKATATGPLDLPLTAAVSGDPYQENNFSPTCYTQAGVGLFLVDRFRFFVMTFGNTPYLMLDQGLDWNQNGVAPNQDGVAPGTGDTDDLRPVAANVEDMQVAYLLNVGTPYGFTAPDSNTNWVIGDASGVLEEPNPAVAAPVYATAYNDPTRFNMNPANVVGVRVTLSVRSSQPDPSQPQGWLGDPLKLSEDRNVQLTNLGRYRRYTISTSVTLHNMSARSLAVF